MMMLLFVSYTIQILNCFLSPKDRRAAGDAFVAGILSQLATNLSLLQNEDGLREALKFSNPCGALTVKERGAIPACQPEKLCTVPSFSLLDRVSCNSKPIL